MIHNILTILTRDYADDTNFLSGEGYQTAGWMPVVKEILHEAAVYLSARTSPSFFKVLYGAIQLLLGAKKRYFGTKDVHNYPSIFFNNTAVSAPDLIVFECRSPSSFSSLRRDTDREAVLL